MIRFLGQETLSTHISSPRNVIGQRVGDHISSLRNCETDNGCKQIKGVAIRGSLSLRIQMIDRKLDRVANGSGTQFWVVSFAELMIVP